MVGHLQVIAGPDIGRAFPLENGQTLLIGRGQNTGTQLKDLQVSRVHCEVQVAGDQLRVVDNESASGTFVNGRRVTESAVRQGDMVQIGETQMMFQPARAHDLSTLMAAAPDRPAPPPKAADLSANMTGQTILHYEVGPVLARGQNGTVYKARDTRDGKTVALKVLNEAATDTDEEVQRFIRAMKTVITLKHPNLVAVHSAGKYGPVCWVAMEYVEGESLTQVIQRIGTIGMLDWRYALTVAVQIARALEAAHEQHIVHRNVTPENILVRKQDNVAKLGDLMLAKALEGMHAKQVTQPGQLVGALAYMAPERTREDAAVDTRSDIFGLGATVYALLTGRSPFEGQSLVETIQKIRSAEPVKPKKYQMSIPDLFEGTVLKMLAKRPDDRFQTPAELLKDLERAAKYNGVTL
jgi:serine/threonine protein kinase